MDFNKREAIENNHISPPSKSNELKKCCADCNTTRTPCWRGGPAGPRTLCNACGIRYRKKRRALAGFDDGGVKRKNKSKIAKSSSSKLGVALKLGLLAFGKDRAFNQGWRRKLGEEEQAAILLMALSCGSAYS